MQARVTRSGHCFVSMAHRRRCEIGNKQRQISQNIFIDRRRHMEIAWKRQMQIEADIAAELSRSPDGVVWEVRDLAHLEKIHKIAGGRVVVMLAYSRSCGSCKRAVEFLQQMSRQVRAHY